MYIYIYIHTYIWRGGGGGLPGAWGRWERGTLSPQSNTFELIPVLGALLPRGGPVQDPVLTRYSHHIHVYISIYIYIYIYIYLYIYIYIYIYVYIYI